jgi:hypothetical protein
MACVRMRVADGRVLELIRGWLRAPVIEEDETGGRQPPQKTEKGTPQGGVISPLLANVYLHCDVPPRERAGPLGQRPAGAVRGRLCATSAEREPQGSGCARNCAADEGKVPRNLLAGAGSKSPSAAVVKSHGGEHEKEKARQEPGQIRDRKLNANEPLMKCRKRRNEVKTAHSRWRGTSTEGTCLRSVRSPALRWQDPVSWRWCGTWEPSASMPTETLKQRPCKSPSRNATQRDGTPRSSNEVPNKGMEPRGRVQGGWEPRINRQREESA